MGGWRGGWVDGVVGGVVAGCCNAMVAWVVAHYQYVDEVLGGWLADLITSMWMRSYSSYAAVAMHAMRTISS